MALEKDALAAKFVEAFARIRALKNPGPPPPPLLPLAVAKELALAYHDWVSSSSPKAGGALSIVTPGQPSVLETALSAAPLLAGWTPGLQAYWGPVTWAGPGYEPAAPTIPASLSGIAPELAVLMAPPPKVKNEEEFADKLAVILHKYTTMLEVTATKKGGSPSPVPVT